MLIANYPSISQQSVVSVDAIALVNARIGVAYEYSVTKSIAAKVKFETGKYATADSFSADNAYELTGFAIIPEFRYYPFHSTRASPRGFFLGASYRYLKFEERYEDATVGVIHPRVNTGSINNLGLDTGYKFNYKQICFELVLGIGSGWINNESDFASASIPKEFSHALKDEKKYYRAEVSIGYIFPKGIE